MLRVLRRLVSALPIDWQRTLRQAYYKRQLTRGTFVSDEREWSSLSSFLGPGDWALDIGANIGHYSERMSTLVGPTGRVFAFEPLPSTFAILASNVLHFRHRNVTLLNLAASDAIGLVRIASPADEPSTLGETTKIDPAGAIEVFRTLMPASAFPHRIAVVKIDVEGHELSVLHGLESVLVRDRPVLIVEWNDPAVIEFTSRLGYELKPLASASNYLFIYPSPRSASTHATSLG